MARAKPTVTYKKKDQVAWISMNRPEFNNAQNGKMTYDLDKFFKRAVDDDDVKVIVLKGNGKHFSAGHDIGTPGRDVDIEYDRKSMWYDHTNKPGGEFWYVREQEVYLICVGDGETYQSLQLQWSMEHVLQVVVCLPGCAI